MIKHIIRISKEADRALNDRQIRKQLDTILAGVSTAQRTSKGWELSFTYPSKPWREGLLGETTKEHIYHCEIKGLNNRPKANTKVIESEFENLLLALNSKGKLSHWSVTQVDSKAYDPAKQFGDAVNGDVNYAHIEIPANWNDYFRGLYGLDAHINIIRRSLEAAISSGWRHRFHCALVGPPGCGKSHICQCLKEALGAEAVMEYDATATTAAGAIKDLKEKDQLPRVIVVEEIEKAPDGALSWLLAFLDLRGEIRKATARDKIERETRLLCVATVNDKATFDKVAYGALASRFANTLHFRRPSRELLERILEREIAIIGGDDRWIRPTLDYVIAKNITDPRKVIAIMGCGREQLITRKYQKQLDETSEVVD